MSRTFLAFDIETAKEVPGDDFNWKPHRPLGISCAATFAVDSDAPRLWHGGVGSGAPSPRLNQDEAARLVNYLSEMVAAGYMIVT